MSFDLIARLLLPPGGGGEIAEADGQWASPQAAHEARTMVWGREPTWEPAGLALARFAGRRERALLSLRRPTDGLRLVRVHRWGSRFHRARRVPGLMWRLREGAVVELARGPQPPRVADAVARTAGVASPIGRFHIAAGGGMTVRTEGAGRRVVLRIGVTGSGSDPSASAKGLERLAPLAHPCVPELLGRGTANGASWTLESELAGRVPSRLTPAVVAAAAAFCARLPAQEAAPTAFGEHIAQLVDLLPDRAAALRALEARVAPHVAELPSVLAHGDLWTGNLLMQGPRLRGVIDWETWHLAAVPGTDLMHLIGADLAARSQRTFAELMPDRPWRSPLFRGTPPHYWEAVGVEPTERVLKAIAIAWWAGQTAIRLGHRPADAADAVWRHRNVDAALTAT